MSVILQDVTDEGTAVKVFATSHYTSQVSVTLVPNENSIRTGEGVNHL